MSDEVLKMPQEWAAEDGILILDPDGWRMPYRKSFAEPISHEEFEWRAARSTSGPMPPPSPPQRWELPPEPGPEVKAVRDRDGDLWQRVLGGWQGRTCWGDVFDWRAVTQHAPLVDATGEVQS